LIKASYIVSFAREI